MMLVKKLKAIDSVCCLEQNEKNNKFIEMIKKNKKLCQTV